MPGEGSSLVKPHDKEQCVLHIGDWSPSCCQRGVREGSKLTFLF